MFVANKENFRCKPTNTNITRCLDPPLSTPASAIMLICPERGTGAMTIRKPVHILRISTACSTTSSNFHKGEIRYQTSKLDVNVSLNMANLHMVNVSALDFCIWQHLEDNRSETQLQHLTTIPSIPIHQIYQHMINGTQHTIPVDTTEESTEDTDLIWTLFSHTGMYVTDIGLLIPAGAGIFCYFFWCQPARLACQTLQPGNM